MLFGIRVFHPSYKNPMIFQYNAESYNSLTSLLTDIQGVFSEECCIEVFSSDMSLRFGVICGFSAQNDYSKKCPYDPEYFVG